MSEFPRGETMSVAVLIVFLALLAFACSDGDSGDSVRLADPEVSYTRYDLHLQQSLVNDAPIGPGEPQPSDHCPTEPGTWYAGSGRSTATSNVFGDLTEVEVYCINVERAELSGGLATWTDIDGDTVSMSFGAKLLKGFAYTPTPNASMIGFAQFTGGTGKWTGLTGDAFFTGRQNGDGTATIEYRGTIYLPQ
jgi:hypothetical protein